MVAVNGATCRVQLKLWPKGEYVTAFLAGATIGEGTVVFVSQDDKGEYWILAAR